MNLKRYLLLSVLFIIGLILVVYFKLFSSTEIVILDHMTEMEDGTPNQICLVKNPPLRSQSLYENIEVFNKANPTENGLFQRIFIKNSDYELPFMPFAENIDYASSTTSRDDLYNMDFLGHSNKYLSHGGDTIIDTEVYVGEIDYYKR